MRILKYELKIQDKQIIKANKILTPLHVGEQDGKLMLWAITGNEDKEHPILDFMLKVEIIGTGQQFEPKLKNYAGTVIMSTGFVWHIYTEIEPIERG